MAQAVPALSAPVRGRNTPSPEIAGLHHEWAAALSIWASLPPGTQKRAKVCRQLIELRGRLDTDCRVRLLEPAAYPAGTRVYASCEAYDVAGRLAVDHEDLDGIVTVYDEGEGDIVRLKSWLWSIAVVREEVGHA